MDHTVVLILVFWGTSILFSIVTVPVYLPINSTLGFPFLSILIQYFLSFWEQLLWWVWGGVSLWFWFAFSRWWGMLSTFPCACWPACVSSLGKCLLRSSAHLKKAFVYDGTWRAGSWFPSQGLKLKIYSCLICVFMILLFVYAFLWYNLTFLKHFILKTYQVFKLDVSGFILAFPCTLLFLTQHCFSLFYCTTYKTSISLVCGIGGFGYVHLYLI